MFQSLQIQRPTRTFSIIAILLCVFANTQVSKAQKSQRLPVPSASEQTKSRAAVKAAFGELSKAKAPSARTHAVNTLLDHAAKENDVATRYALIMESQSLAIQWEDSAGLNRTIDALAEQFDVNDVEARLNAFSTLARNASDKNVHRAIVLALMQTARTSQEAGQFNDAQRLLTGAAMSVQRSGDTNLRKDWVAERARLNILKREQDRYEQYQTVLLRKPFDPTANHHVGKYECFVLGNWRRGLPYLTKSSDEMIANAAKLDLASPTTPQDIAAVADAWWQVSEKKQATNQLRIQQRAVMWYEKEYKQLDGLTKILADKRMKTFSESGGSRSLLRPEKTTDLLASAQTRGRAIKGKWSHVNGELLVESGDRTIYAFDHKPASDDYEVIVEFTRHGGRLGFGLVLQVDNKPFLFQLSGGDGDKVGISGFGSSKSPTNPNVIRKRLKMNGKRQKLRAKVTPQSITFWLNDQHLHHYRWEFDTYTKPTFGQGDAPIGLISWWNNITFHKIEVSESDGRGAKRTIGVGTTPSGRNDTEGKSIDVLANLNLNTDAAKKAWSTQGKNFVYSVKKVRDRANVFGFDVKPEGDYELRIRFTRVKGQKYLGIHLPVGGRSVYLALDHVKRTGGLALINRQPVWHKTSPTHVPDAAIHNGKTVLLEIKVTSKEDQIRIQALRDGKPFVDWSGPPSKLQSHWTSRPKDMHKLGIAADEGDYHFHEFFMRPLGN